MTALLTHELSEALERTLARMSDHLLGTRATLPDASLSSGGAGIAFSHIALESAFAARGHIETADRILHDAVDTTCLVGSPPSLFNGHVGTAFAVQALALSRSDIASDPLRDLDASLATHLAQDAWRDGLAGPRDLADIGVYALSRAPRRAAQRIVELVVERLAETVELHAEGATWPTDFTTASRPAVEWGIGLAHGIAGIIAFLARVAGSSRQELDLLGKSVDWLLAQELPATSESCFSASKVARSVGQPSRLALCKGDPGIAAALLDAARAAREPAWEHDAIRIASRAAARSRETSGVVDPYLCHGALGVAHVFQRLFRATEDPRLGAATRTWLERGIAMLDETSPADLGLVDGAAGVALVLLDAAEVQHGAATWSEAFFMTSRAPC